MTERKRTYILISIMIGVCFISVGIAIYLLYLTGLKEQKKRLRETVQSQARLIETVALHDRVYGKDYPGGPIKATLDQISNAHEGYKRFGKTNEFTLGRREGDNIIFLLQHRHSGLENRKPISIQSNLAEPMRLALSGKSGVLIGYDYRKKIVLAAHEPVSLLNWGVVAKIDLSEIRAPFVRGGLIVAIFAIFFVFVGTILFFRIFNPFIEKIQKQADELSILNTELIEEMNEHESAKEKLKHFSLIISSSDDAIISKTLDGSILTWNRGAERIYGYSEKEVQGESISILVPPERSDEATGFLKKIKAGEKIDHFETIRRRKDGALITVSLTISPIKDNTGNIIGASTIARDFTKHKETEMALLESEQRFRGLVENSLTGISIIQDDQIIYQNPEQERLLGPLPRAPKFTDVENIHPDDVEKVSKFYQNLNLEENRVKDIDFRFNMPDQVDKSTDMKWINCRGNVINYRGSKAIIVNIMDITRAKELEHLVRVQDKMASLGRVAAGIAHEIRNPLSGINVYLNTLEKFVDRGEDPEKIKGIFPHVQSASNKIESVIKRVMDFSKPSTPEFTLIDINIPIEDAVNLSAVTLRKRGIQIEKSLTEDLPPCEADPQMIEEVILNLINNAAEAMKDIKGDKKIGVGSSIENNQIVIRVSDSDGPGIPSNLANKIFDPFYSTKDGSSGIGLSICHRIVKDHDGSFNISQGKWGGAEFIIEIPMKRGEV